MILAHFFFKMLIYITVDSLSGNSKILMFLNISNKGACQNQTIFSLKFGEVVYNCHIDKANHVLSPTEGALRSDSEREQGMRARDIIN